MANDEPVDGPRIAAQILKHMTSADQERLVKAIDQKDPGLAKQVRDNLFTFEDIADLTTQGLQILLREVEHRDLVIALTRASQKLSQKLFSNMSERKRKLVEDDAALLGALPLPDVEAAQRRIVLKVDELRTNGSIRSESAKDVWI